MAHRAYYVEKIFLKGLLVVGAYTLSLRIMRRTNFRDYTSKFEPYRPAFERDLQAIEEELKNIKQNENLARMTNESIRERVCNALPSDSHCQRIMDEFQDSIVEAVLKNKKPDVDLDIIIAKRVYEVEGESCLPTEYGSH